MNRSLLAGVVLLAAGAADPLAAQAPGGSLAQGIRAYQDLEFDAAAMLLRRSLTASGDVRTAGDSARVLSYLGAAEYFGGRRDTAKAVFQQLVVLDPRRGLDQVVFPPELSSFFEGVRRATPALAADARDDRIVPGVDRYALRLHASTYHEIEVVLQREDGTVVRRLYTGPIGGSLAVEWDGLDGSGAVPSVGSLILVVTSRNGRGGAARLLRVPFTIRRLPVDTLSHPQPPAQATFLPELQRGGPATGPLITSFIAGAAVVGLPRLISADNASPARFAVAGAVGVTGIATFFAQRRNEPLAGNIAINRARRAAWERERAAAIEENTRRRRAARFEIVPGTPSRIEVGGT